MADIAHDADYYILCPKFNMEIWRWLETMFYGCSMFMRSSSQHLFWWWFPLYEEYCVDQLDKFTDVTSVKWGWESFVLCPIPYLTTHSIIAYSNKPFDNGLGNHKITYILNKRIFLLILAYSLIYRRSASRRQFGGF